MAEYNKPTTEQEFEVNFKQKKPLMNDTEAYYESSRCLYCYDAPCVTACPTGIDIPLFIKQIHTKNIIGAAKTIYNANWLGNACGTVCPTGTRHVMDNNVSLFKASNKNNKKVAIIGAGPAGIACACELRMMGYEVVIYEAKAKPSGLNVYGVAPYKITNEEAVDEITYLQNQLDFNIKYNHPIVIGGGNTAMDAASEAARMGASEVFLVYRRSKKEKGAYEFEYDLAKSAGVQGVFNATPKAIIGNSSVTGVTFKRTAIVDDCLQEVEDSEFTIDCDMVIKATGQSKKVELLGMMDIELDKKNKIMVDSKTFQTKKTQYFAGGDAVNGGAEVVNAAYDGKMAARGIDEWLLNNK